MARAGVRRIREPTLFLAREFALSPSLLVFVSIRADFLKLGARKARFPVTVRAPSDVFHRAVFKFFVENSRTLPSNGDNLLTFFFPPRTFKIPPLLRVFFVQELAFFRARKLASPLFRIVLVMIVLAEDRLGRAVSLRAPDEKYANADHVIERRHFRTLSPLRRISLGSRGAFVVVQPGRIGRV